jgi:hypothetical protein
MENHTVQIVGMVWYDSIENYEACLRIMRDSHKLPARYHLWRMKAETGEKSLRRQGKTVVRVVIDPKAFTRWCHVRGLDLDADARNQYAARVAYQIATGGQADSGTH